MTTHYLQLFEKVRGEIHIVKENYKVKEKNYTLSGIIILFIFIFLYIFYSNNLEIQN